MQNCVHAARAAGMLVAVALCGVPAFGAAITIDNFSAATASWPLDQNTIGNPEVENVGPGMGVLGGVRKTSISNFVPGGGINHVEVGVFPAPAPGFLDFAASVGTAGDLTLRYDADPNADGLAPNLNFDLTASPTIEIVFSYFDYANDEPLDVAVTVRDGVGAVQMESQSLSQVVDFPTLYTMSFDFSTRAGTVDKTDIDSIDVEFAPGAATDFRIQEIRAVPEPAAAALLALGTLFVVRRRR